LIVFQGEIGHSNCHGDSGGPAYAKIRDSKTGKSQWFVVGTAAGFDLALTPDSYKALDDEDFPFVAKCDQSQTIYSFIGDYTSWIESNSNSKASRLGASRDLPPGQFAETVSDAKTFSWYCKNVEFADPRWGAVRELMIAATEIESEFSSSDVFTDCDLAEAILDKVEFIQLDEISYVDDLEPFSALPNLKRLSVKDIEMPDFSSLDSESLVELRLQNVSGLKNLSFLQTFPSADQLRALEVRSSKLASSSGISNASSLRELVLGDNELKFLTEIEELSMLETLNVSSNDIYELFGLAGLKHLAKLNAHGNALVALPPLPAAVELNISGNQISSLEFLRDSKALVSLSASGNTIVDLGPLYFSKHLTQLDVSNNPINLPISGIWLPTIEVLRLNSVSIRSLDFLSHSFSLKRLYIANTQVDSLQPLAGLPNLKTLFAGGTPVSKLKDPDSDLCPIDAKNAVSGFCKRLTANSKLSPNVRWRFM
ncbi:MAG: hypothetical protein HRT45_18075, partial [Bdellovibrionales bacterium]|nr:hypothetical protein [Bdellovibrionales bacterium]